MVLALLLALLLASPALAQSPERPKLGRDADPNDWRSYYTTGLKALGSNPQRAAELFWWSSRLSPGSAEPLHGRWVALWLANPRLLEEVPGAGSREEAYAMRIDSVLLEAFAIDPFTPRQFSRLIYDAIPGAWGNDAFTKGFLAYTEGRYQLAVSHLRKSTNGRLAREARYYRALSFHSLQRFDSAAVELAALAELARRENASRTRVVYETPAVYEYGVALAKVRLRDWPGARAALQRALEEDLAMAAAHAALAYVAQEEGNAEEMLREWEQTVELRPRSAHYHDGHATALRAAGQLEQAVAAYARAIELEPHWAAPRYNAALVLDQLGRQADAAGRYREFVERAPKAYATQVAHAEGRIAALATP